jgi:hypothetical protein
MHDSVICAALEWDDAFCEIVEAKAYIEDYGDAAFTSFQDPIDNRPCVEDGGLNKDEFFG